MKLYSDDFGYNQEADYGIISLIKKGKLIGVSVLSTMVSTLSLRRLNRVLNGKNNFILGLHLNLIEGKPAQHFLKVNTLVGQNGLFFSLVFFLIKILLGKVDKSQLKSEVENQLDILRKKGLTVKIVDSHQHTHAFSPVAEIVDEVAREQNISYLRSFNSIKTYSLKAKFTYFFLKVLAFLSYFATYKKIGMPVTWRLKKKFDWTVMSWEGDSFDATSIKDNRAAFVIHPYLPYDTNRSYKNYIK
ncbi:hypothetical protein A3C98_01925 [Candidatus Roizmanbacteria bacterium RIFCSPHIGHO2_02_FULL_37_15]|uniref:NodB homology domain-containing protein n=1 Tax=Candidatus Roizmanbacteria bacterium RIFCSPLOWO2_01_FULL_37_16 TaxID=1802058 RepID=A0A1F7IJD6_9BACT|nr:MAG: hypothetical protein A2859_05940 [Candidatus Roizmanbacteria bacterium RIFCSPHIGHO2_01_FULL_37_16b]OGK20835.1 MAG: hypothetical protein A3C98_01925 [Candidatus Roizmanbacteria bacterium RIFCSPHIGHO2_02_FULL_37_15]OGK31368.1 MAG: hypothetical protein A3F57_02685 [Candidatus Roizmanbacteria bacterium RIFCSPHIGHO2_12_FULL_36_11]OGK43460.1 MAG: hypothetical protein A3B40_01915 [Candidatus Roizmanbacteria bacterium RIFCSPLOWO2_01_FULL_37_16]OGK56241.1 MAG: hypothetical protein A3I50_05225 [C